MSDPIATDQTRDIVERVKTMQGVYDLIISTCQDDPEFHAWGASALRYLNKTEALTKRVAELEEAIEIEKPPATLTEYLDSQDALRAAKELRLWAKHLRTWTCDREDFGTVRPLKEALKNAASMIDAALSNAARGEEG
jgi:hypothetical protein